MANLNVYVPAGLAQRLEPFKERIKVSEVCQAALQRAIDAEEAADRGNRIPRILERLNRTLSPADAAKADGSALGSKWAEESAAMTELEQVARLEQLAENWVVEPQSLHRLDSGGFALSWTDGEGKREMHYLPDTVPTDWFEEIGESPFFDDYVWGFIVGAAAVHHAVKAEVERQRGAVDPDDIPF